MSQASQDYQRAMQALIDRYDNLFIAPKGPLEGGPRAAGDIPAAHFVEAAEQVTVASAALTRQGADLIATGTVEEREGVSAQLLAQAAAELNLATELLRVAEEGRGAETASRAEMAPRAPQADRGSALRQAVVDLRDETLHPPQDGLAAYLTIQPRTGALPQEASAAADLLRRSAVQATQAITRQTADLGGAIAFDLVMQTRWAAVLDGALLLRGDAAGKLSEIRQGLSGVVQQAAGTAEKALLNVYDKVLAILGKDVEDAARKQIRAWLEKIKQDGKIELLESLITGLFRSEAFLAEMDAWLKQTGAPAAAVGKTAGEVEAVAQKFAELCKRLNTLENAVGLAKLTGIPQVLMVVAGLQVGMLAVVVYAGYDYIGYEQKKFLDVTQGVAQVVRRGLEIA